jgi:hypothetical protein
MAVSFKGAHFPQEVILMGVRWYVAYPLSTRHVEELMEEPASWTQICIYGESRRIMQYIVVRSPRC